VTFDSSLRTESKGACTVIKTLISGFDWCLRCRWVTVDTFVRSFISDWVKSRVSLQHRATANMVQTAWRLFDCRQSRVNAIVNQRHWLTGRSARNTDGRLVYCSVQLSDIWVGKFVFIHIHFLCTFSFLPRCM